MIKKFIYSTLALVLACSCTSNSTNETQEGDTSVNVMSFNVRYDNQEDSLNGWAYRRDRAANAIKFYDADIIGSQETLHNQVVDLQERLPEYTMLGVGREDGKEQGEYSAIWFKKDRFAVVDSGYFWLSETPDVAGSKGWDGACERIATWAVLKDNVSGKELFFINTHLDHVGVVARREGINLLFSKINEYAGERPVIATGDYNSTPESDVVAHITNNSDPSHLIDSRTIAPVVYGPAWSWHDFGGLTYAERPLIDYVFVRGDLDVNRYGILAEEDNGEYLSDHAPVLVNITLK